MEPYRLGGGQGDLLEAKLGGAEHGLTDQSVGVIFEWNRPPNLTNSNRL